MDRCLWIIGVCVAAALVVAGCAAPGDSPAGKMPQPQASSGPTQPPPPIDPRALQDAIAELERAGRLDPHARAQLSADLQQTDPAYWPLLLKNFRAALAARNGQAPVEHDSIVLNRQEGRQVGNVPHLGVEHDSIVLNRQENRHVGNVPHVEPNLFPQGPPNVLGNGPQCGPPEPNRDISLVSHDEPLAPLTPRDKTPDPLAAAIGAMESEVSKQPQTAEEIADHARLRLLYLAAGRTDDAVLPIPSADASQQEFWSELLFGLGTCLDTKAMPDDSRRASAAKPHLDAAVARLGESASLELRNLRFCQSVVSYGCFTPFAKDEFEPGQKVMLYAELENFATRQDSDGNYETAIQSRLEIFDAGGRPVVEHQFDPMKETCQNPRRDFFIHFTFPIPPHATPGKHTLKLTVEDLQTHRIRQRSIAFDVKSPGK